MNRIICDICGSEYPQNEERCPICSYPRQGNENMATAAAEASYTKVKGGRFSSRNVKKRMKAQKRAENVEIEKDPNKPLIITIAILLIAIALVTAFIALRFFWDGLPAWQSKAPAVSTTSSSAVPCSGIALEAQILDFEALGEQKQIVVQCLPEDTTDTVTFVSADPSVAEVSGDGLITAVGTGETTITITCGTISKDCTVVCWFREETTIPADTTAPTETEPEETKPEESKPEESKPENGVSGSLTLDRNDVSFFNVGEAFTLSVHLDGVSVSRSKVTWSTSSSRIATVENGLVVAVGKGTATITAEYEGKKATCIVRCQFAPPTSEDENQQDQEEQENEDRPQDTSWKISHTDVTLAADESFSLTVKNRAGETADTIWTMSVDGIVAVNGNTITGKTPGTVTLKTEVDGVTFSCIVRVN